AVTGGLPKYHYFQLIDCAREVAACPEYVGEGLRNEGSLQKGFAYCGTPRRRWLNDGTYLDAPQGMMFVVYVAQEGSVFDWDWKRLNGFNPANAESSELPRYMPASDADRAELLVGNVLGQAVQAFQSGRPWYSVAGDCIF